MKSKFILLTLCFSLVLMLLTQASSAQQRKTMTFEAEEGEITMISGLGAILRKTDEGIIIEMIPPSGMRQKEYKDLDLANQDKVIMCNGKKVKTIQDLDAIIETIEIGGEISFGIKRGKEMMLVSFPKADPASNKNMMMMTMEVDGDGGEKTSIMKDGVELKDVVMFDAGLILKDIDGKTNVLAVLPNFSENEKVQDGDIITEINGAKDLTAEEMNKAYNKIKIGEEVTLTFSRNDKDFKVTFKKAPFKDDGEVIIER